MSWLAPIGFLGFLGVVALIIIYIIKPNYQNKIITSTFVWKLSLKLRKKKIPISKLRNIILFICQVLAICSFAFILAQPFIPGEQEVIINENIVIIDGSASMMTESKGETRFERAVEQVRTLATETFEAGGKMTVILAGREATILASGVGAENSNLVYNALDELISPMREESPLTWSKGDIEGAIKLSEESTAVNPNSSVLIYTDTNYIDAGKIVVKDVKDSTEWNAAILDARAVMDENYYRIEIDVAVLGGADADVEVYCDIYGANGDNANFSLSGTARCISGNTTTLVFGKIPTGMTAEDAGIEQNVEVYSFSNIIVRVEENDSFEHDNRFEIYGGEKQPLRIMYASSAPNNFFASSLMVLRDALGKRWDVEFVEDKNNRDIANTEYEGYDVYIFEHTIPKTLPNDGVVILANPDQVPSITGLRLGRDYQTGGREVFLSAGDEHELMKGITADNISVTKFTEISNADGYVPLMCIENGAQVIPLVMAKNEPDQKIVAMTFSLNYSNFAVLFDFPLFMYNIFQYYMPTTLNEYVYDIYEEVSLDSRSETLTVVDQYDNEIELTEFPSTVTVNTPGRYEVSQTPISGDEVREYFYVRIPASESDIAEVVDTLQNPYFAPAEEREDFDLILYFALALVILLFAEWWLQSREQF